MKYMLDTNICIAVIRKKPKTVIETLVSKNIGDVVISSITFSELTYGVEKSSDTVKNRIALMEFLTPLNIIDYDSKAALVYGNIRADLERRGAVIGSMDMLIAAHALSLNLTLVTNNTDEFKRVSKLKIEDWIR